VETFHTIFLTRFKDFTKHLPDSEFFRNVFKVARKVCEKGSKRENTEFYPFWLQAFYVTEYLFIVDENVLHSLPPKVKSKIVIMAKGDYSLHL